MATSNSTGAITYTVVSGPAAINGATLSLTGAGIVTIQAAQAASQDYLAGIQQATFPVAARAQTINFVQPSTPVMYGVGPIALSASATSSLPVTFQVVSGPGLVNGSTLSVTGAGTLIITANQAGNADYLPGAPVSHTIAVNQIAVAAVGITAAPNPALVKASVTLTATVSSPVEPPTGTVVFADGGSPLGTTMLMNGVATLTLTTLTAGQHSLTAAYSGDANFKPLNSTALLEEVQDFQVNSAAGNPPSQTISPGGTATYGLAFSPVGASTFPGTVSLSASGLPAGAIATFTPQIIAAGAATTDVTLNIQTLA